MPTANAVGFCWLTRVARDRPNTAAFSTSDSRRCNFSSVEANVNARFCLCNEKLAILGGMPIHRAARLRRRFVKRSRTLQTIEWNNYPLQTPPAKERLLLIVSAAGRPPSLKLISKSELAMGYWSGDAFRLMSGYLRPRLMSDDWQPAVTHWARLASCLPEGIDLVRDIRFDPEVRD